MAEDSTQRQAGAIQAPVRGQARTRAPAWQWTRTGQTQQALLEAAREVFAERGFAKARVADIAARAGMTPGVIYHHFGGKDELYLALWRRHGLAHEEASAKAVARARADGITDSAGLWAAGARAVLRGTWARKDLAALFFAGNGPPGFEALRRQRRGIWDRQADSLLDVTTSSREGLYAGILTALMSEGARAVVAARTRAEADEIIEDVIVYATRLITGGPARRRGAKLS